MDSTRLRSVMVLHKDTGKSLSDFLGISEQSFSQKINEKNGKGFNKKEIQMIAQRYELSPSDIVSIFFTNLVS